jgi:type VI secretion system protein ImpH
VTQTRVEYQYAEPAAQPAETESARQGNGDPGVSEQAVESLLAELTQSLNRWDFFSAVRWLECTASHLPRVGHSIRPDQDLVRFAQHPSLAFAPTDLVRLEPPRVAKRSDGTPAAMRFVLSFFGLLGPNGPMPQSFTDYVVQRAMNEDPTLAEFLDLFHHRMVSLYYRAWSSTQQAVNFERGAQDRFAHYVGSLFGRADARNETEGLAKLHHAGRMVNQTRNAEGLEAVLGQFFGMPVQVEEFVGDWQEIPEQYRCYLRRGALNTCLGQPDAARDPDGQASTAIVGGRVWDCQHKIRVKVGPLSREQFQRLLPPGQSLQRLIHWVNFYAGSTLVWDLNLVLAKDQVTQTGFKNPGRLGWDIWLNSQQASADADELVLSPATAPWRRVYEEKQSAQGGDIIHQLQLSKT